VWARSGDANAFRATEVELKRFAALFNDINSVPGTGADLEEIHYIVPRVEEKLIFGKKEQTGFFAAKTNQAIVIAMYEGDNAQSASVRAGVGEAHLWKEGANRIFRCQDKPSYCDCNVRGRQRSIGFSPCRRRIHCPVPGQLWLLDT
ncbi:hypothetical protein EXU34_22745, partial [Alteromonas sp. ZYF713]|nr:hypothetical protein [Alteromonas sp. ZYF713]